MPEGDVATKVEFSSIVFNQHEKLSKRSEILYEIKVFGLYYEGLMCFFFVGWKTKPKIGDSVREYAEN